MKAQNQKQTGRASIIFAKAFCCLVGFISLMEPVMAQPRQGQVTDAIEGLDPVLLVQGKETQGEMKITVTRGQFRYLFASETNKAIFEKDPARYEIQLGGACARMGAPVTGNPDLFAVHQGRIYIFGSEVCQQRFKAAPEKYLEPEKTYLLNGGATPEAIKKGQALIEKAAAAMGGAKLDGLTSYREKSKASQIRGRNDEIEVTVNTNLLIVFPDRIRFEQTMPDYRDHSTPMNQTMVMLPGEAFGLGSRGLFAIRQNVRESEEKRIRQKPLFLLRARKNPGFKAAALGADKFGETEIEQVAVDFEGAGYLLRIDPATGRVLSMGRRQRGPQGDFGLFERTFSDFRAVDGVTLPFKVTATFNGQPWKDQSVMIEEIVINGKVDPALFERPKADNGQ